MAEKWIALQPGVSEYSTEAWVGDHEEGNLPPEIAWFEDWMDYAQIPKDAKLLTPEGKEKNHVWLYTCRRGEYDYLIQESYEVNGKLREACGYITAYTVTRKRHWEEK